MEKIGLNLPAGRRKAATITLLTSLVEGKYTLNRIRRLHTYMHTCMHLQTGSPESGFLSCEAEMNNNADDAENDFEIGIIVLTFCLYKAALSLG